MTHDDLPPNGTLYPLFEAARIVEPVSDVDRARSLARARLLAAEPRPVLPQAVSTRASRRKVALAVAPVVILMATGVAAAFLGRAPMISRPASHAAAPAERDLPRPTLREPAPLPVLEPKPAVVAVRPRRIATGRDVRAAELAVIRRAQAAYADDDYLAVLDIVAEHARRFPTGRLAEEGEALRVRSLAHCGRGQDALRAMDAFAGRFPNSVLLPALRRSVGRELEKTGSPHEGE